MNTDLATLQGFFASAPFMADLGVVPVAGDPGRLTTRLDVVRRHRQHTGVTHAGVLASMADHSMGAAAQTLAPAGHWILTAELKTSVLRGVATDTLECVAWVLKPGRMLSFTEAEVHAVGADGTRTLVMKASATMAVVPADR